MNVTTYTPVARKRVSLPFSSFFSGIKNIFTKPRRLIFVAIALAAAAGIYFIFFSKEATTEAMPLSHNFEVVAKTKDGKTTNGTFPIEVFSASKAESVLVQGQKVMARNDKVFLVLNMEISNNYNLPLYTYPVDSFRLIDQDGKKFAPTAHQGNVEVRPQSTKNSNVGFVVPDSQKTFKVEVGEFNGEKTILEFTLK